MKEELEDAVKKLNECLELLGDIDLYGVQKRGVKIKNQKKVIRAYNVLYHVRDRLDWVKDEEIEG